MNEGRTNALFARFARLSDRIPWRPLGRFPTAIEEMDSPAPGIRLLVKRDDVSAPEYGGNKVRKLEFLLAEAALSSRRTLITLGGIGSNHALATAIYGRKLGFDVDLVLYRQPVNEFVRRNLGAFLETGADIHFGGSTTGAFMRARRLLVQRRREGRDPYFVMVGGTCRLGTMGHVSAALELAEQISSGAVPTPDVIFVPLGTTGTAAGLLAGLKLAGLRTRLVAVRVADPVAANATVLRYFAQDALDFLRSVEPSIPALRISSTDFAVLPGYIGPGYGHGTPEGQRAIAAAAGQITLEPTYTAKTFAACLDYCASRGSPATVLFWNTFSSAPIPEPASLARLPEAIRDLVAVPDQP